MPRTFGFNLKRYGASRPVTTEEFSIRHRTACTVPLKVRAIGRGARRAGFGPRKTRKDAELKVKGTVSLKAGAGDPGRALSSQEHLATYF
ncbi:MAG: hypothetical protein RL215_247, partial [Planctomycetota bacterium]